MKVLFLSTPVGPLGSGMGGGVELTLSNIAIALQQKGYEISIVAPAGSVVDALPTIQIAGALQVTAQSQTRDALITLPANSVLANMWDYAHQVQAHYDLLLNFAYDWLPFYLTPWFQHPVAHLVSMASLNDAMDHVIQTLHDRAPGTIAVHTQAQAATFSFGDRLRCVGNGFDLSKYEFCAEPTEDLAWVGRIAPEKGLEDAIAAVQQAQRTLNIWGAIDDADYWNTIQAKFPNAPIRYHGFVPTQTLQQQLRQCRGLIMTPKWIEAFGNVAIEALACGVPVIAYRRGGPSEIVEDGTTGYLVEPDSVAELANAIGRIDRIDRRTCRQRTEATYSLAAMGDRMEQWFLDILQARSAQVVL